MSDVVMQVRAANVSKRHPSILIPIVGFAGLLAAAPLGGLAALISTVPTVVVLILLFVPIVAAMARHEAETKVARAIWLGFVLKLVGFLLRYIVVNSAYNSGDAEGYHQAGRELARSYRGGDLFVPVPGAARGQGTLALRVIVGLIYTVTGSSLLVGAVVLSLLSFTGLVLCVKAFRLAVPDADHARYARLVLLLPSLLFWPSTIGKDAWMLLGLGLVAYGAARLYTRSFGGLALVALGTVELALVRPHIALVAFGSAVVGLLVRRARSARSGQTNLLAKLVLLVPLGIASLLLLSRAQDFLQVGDLSVESVQAAGAQVEDRSDRGGSAFTPVSVDSPVDLPWALVTVLFRPFPFEATNGLAFGIALEGMFLLLFTVVAWRRILAGLRTVLRSPFLVMCGVYTLVFVAAFSNIANFGILARQRVQVFPFVFAFLAAVPSMVVRRASREGAVEPAPDGDGLRAPAGGRARA